MRHSQRLGKEGLIDREGIFFVAAPPVVCFFLFSSVTRVVVAPNC